MIQTYFLMKMDGWMNLKLKESPNYICCGSMCAPFLHIATCFRCFWTWCAGIWVVARSASKVCSYCHICVYMHIFLQLVHVLFICLFCLDSEHRPFPATQWLSDRDSFHELVPRMTASSTMGKFHATHVAVRLHCRVGPLGPFSLRVNDQMGVFESRSPPNSTGSSPFSHFPT